jgi:hypothetical protein
MTSSEDPGSFTLREVSREQWDRLFEGAVPSAEQMQKAHDLLFGDWKRWPCPFCPPKTICKAVGRVGLDESGVPRIEDREDEELEKSKGLLEALTDLPGHLISRLAKGEMAKWQPGFRVYDCRHHGEFYVPFSGGDPNPFHIWVLRDGQLEERQSRFTICPGLTETVDADGQRLRIEGCVRVLEWEGSTDEVGVGAGGYTCPIHGSETFDGHGGHENFPNVVARRNVQP